MSYQIPDSLNADFSQRVVIDSNSLPWLASPQAGVKRRLLDRIGGEVARATSLVEYAPDSAFPSHCHGGGEEFLVLDGIFSDQYGDYPKGHYVRNPPGSEHAPFTREGCVILVKLHQMKDTGEGRVVIDTQSFDYQPTPVKGHWRKILFASAASGEEVTVERLESGVRLASPTHLGEEVLVLAGGLNEGDQYYPSGTWLRNPPQHDQTLATDQGCTLWIKRNHLSDLTYSDGHTF